MTTVKLGDICGFITKGATPTTYGFAWEATGVPFLRSECVSDHGLDMRQSMYISESANKVLRRSRVVKGDILMTITGNVGRVVLLEDLDSANINQHIARIRITDAAFDPGYVYHYLSQSAMREYYESIVTGQAYPQISLAQVRATEIPRLAYDEQVHVRKSLDSADRLTYSLERLIAKKQAIKQGMMQQLLTGRTRLPGFDGRWINLSVKDIVEIPVTDGPHSTPQFLNSGVPFLSVNNLVDGHIDWGDLRYISRSDHEVFSRKCRPRRGDVLLGKAASVGKVAVLDSDQEVNIWSPIALIRPRDSLVSKFIYYQLQSRETERQIEVLTNTSSQGNIGMGEIERIELNLPPRVEQAAIVTALDDIEREISSIRSRLLKSRDIKTGMMQQLLTGRTRLPVEDEP
ncbi:restriction endonuclease subunit S [Gordonia sp. NPDC003950]